MGDPIFFLPNIIQLSAQVASSFTEYLKNVKDAPGVVRNITLEVNTLKGVLETLYLTFEGNQVVAGNTGLAESLNQCHNTLCELEELVAPQRVEDPDFPVPSPRRVRNNNYCPTTPSRPATPSRPITPFQRPCSSHGASPLMQAQAGSEYRNLLHQPRNYGVSQRFQVRTPLSLPAKRPLGDRFKWPLLHQSKAEELLRQLERHKSQLSLAVQADNAMNLSALGHTVKDIEANLDDGGKRNLLAWLKPKIDMYEFHNEQHSKQEEETCEWITDSEGWKQWLNGGSSSPGGYRRFIWIYGIPGAGKTVLASHLIDSIATHCQATGFSYYYCHNERNHDETIHLLRWIVGDLSRQVERFIPRELEELYQSEKFTIPGLLNCFLVVSRQFAQQGRRVYLVIDAVDESRKPRERLLDVLIRIGTDPSFEHVSLLMTSREEPDIRDRMTDLEGTDGFEAATMGVSSMSDYCMMGSSIPYTAITMENGDVMRAIQTYVQKQFQRNMKLKMWPSKFREEVEEQLARNARGMFRWVACQIDIIERMWPDKDRIKATLENLPQTLYDTYARILEDIPQERREFAHTALALICSNTSNIKCADVLLQASLYNVSHGMIHTYDDKVLKETLGCLIKVTELKRKLPTVFRREDVGQLRKVSVAHYTVKEFLFAPSKGDGEPRPAGSFALSDIDIRTLEMQVIFNGLQQWGMNRAQRGPPTRYEEHCLEMSDLALRGDQRNLIVRNHNVWRSVIPCLVPGGPHLRALSTGPLRKRFPNWGRLNAYVELPSEARTRRRGNKMSQEKTSILVSLILLEWPEFARRYLKDTEFEALAPEVKRAVWANEFLLDLPDDKLIAKGEPTTLLHLCALWKRMDFLELFIRAGANFANEPGIIFTALKPYDIDISSRKDSSVTGQVLKMLLERGADPNPPGYRYTPLQYACVYLEEGWVQSLLIEARDANLTGDPKGKHPYGTEDKPWHRRHPLDICRRTKPDWPDKEETEEQTEKVRKQVEILLIQYGARVPPPVQPAQPVQPTVINLAES